MNTTARVIAMYLPQFHPIPENDKYWGTGFTEWVNVAQARPLFKGHYQPRIPADLGFYDLRMPEIRKAQAELARNAGIEGFMYWHYWFGKGRMLLEKPFQEVLNSGEPDYPFCLGWANHSWMTKTWTKGTAFQRNPMIMEQLYPGKEDYISHFNYCLPAFKDHRYIKVDGKPVFTIFAPFDMPDVKDFIMSWRELAQQNGLKGIHFVGLRYKDHSVEDLLQLGFDAVNNRYIYEAQKNLDGSRWITKIKHKLRTIIVNKYDFAEIAKELDSEMDERRDTYPTILSGFDRTARSGKDSTIYYNFTPDTFKVHIKRMLDRVRHKDYEHNIIYLMSWNEWGEGNYMEPDRKYGHGMLDAFKELIFE